MPTPRTLVVLFLAVPPPLPETANAAPPSLNVVRLGRQLGDDEYEIREWASKMLRHSGDEALLPLERAAAGTDPEARRRARGILTTLHRRWQLAVLTGHTHGVIGVAASKEPTAWPFPPMARCWSAGATTARSAFGI